MFAIALAAVCAPAGALNYIVETNADTTSGNSLRNAITAINLSTDSTNTITFAIANGSTISLGSPLPLILNNVTIDGGTEYPVIDGGSTYRIFFIGVDSATQTALHSQFPSAPLGNRLSVTLSNMALENGKAKGGSGGGGGMGAGGAVFVNSAADVTLDGVDLFYNQASGGNGSATINSSEVYKLGGGGGLGGNGGKPTNNNTASGGGIFGNGGSSDLPSGGGIFGNGVVGVGGGGGFTGNGGGNGAAGSAGSQSLAGISGSGGAGGSGGSGGGANGGGGGSNVSGAGGGGGGFGGANGTSNSGGNGGFGGGGGGGVTCGGNGGFGGGGGFGTDNNFACGGTGGFGGFGGGGGTSNGPGAPGGFGGGGGDGYGGGGTGGFGGGGGASCPTGCGGGNGGYGGFGGGTGAADGSGAGAGFGGAVFVVGGGTLSIVNAGAFNADGNVAGGAAGASDAGAGQYAGAGIFLQGSGTLEFSPAAGDFALMDDPVTDETGSAITPPDGYTPGSWGLQQDGAGMVVLDVNTLYTGTTTVNNGVLLDTGISVSPVTVNPGGVLAGTGEFPSVTSSGTLVPGSYQSAQDNFAVVGALTLQSGALTCFHATGSPAASSSITVSLDGKSTSTLAGVARVDFATTPGVGNSFAIIENGSGNNTLSGSFSGLAISPASVDGQLSYTTTEVNFVVTATDGVFRDGFDGGSNDAPCAAGLVTPS